MLSKAGKKMTSKVLCCTSKMFQHCILQNNLIEKLIFSCIWYIREPSGLWRPFVFTLTTQHNTTQHNTTQHNTTQHNTTQHNISKLTWNWKSNHRNVGHQNSKVLLKFHHVLQLSLMYLHERRKNVYFRVEYKSSVVKLSKLSLLSPDSKILFKSFFIYQHQLLCRV